MLRRAATFVCAIAALALFSMVRPAACGQGYEGQWKTLGKAASISAPDKSCPGADYLLTDEHGHQACGQVKGDRLDIPTWKLTAKLSPDGTKLTFSNGRFWQLVQSRKPTEAECGRAQQDCLARCNQAYPGESINQDHQTEKINRASCWGTCNVAFVDCIGGN